MLLRFGAHEPFVLLHKMLRGLNIPLSEWTPEAQEFALQGGAVLVVWAPSMSTIQPTQDQWIDASFDAPDAMVTWGQAHHKQVVIVADPSSYPAWVLGNSTERVAPTDISAEGPWGTYLRKVLEHYKGKATPIILNEPDYAFAAVNPWAAHALVTAEMMKTGATIAHEVGYEKILAPACATVSFAVRVLDQLEDWEPPLKVVWCQHFYEDVMADLPTEGTPKTATLLTALKTHKWSNGYVWFTEGGYVYPVYQSQPVDYYADPATWHYTDLATGEAEQLRRMKAFFDWCTKADKIECLANYEYQDSLWSGWASGMVAYDGTAHPLREAWIQWN
jgi:hypothetical protein